MIIRSLFNKYVLNYKHIFIFVALIASVSFKISAQDLHFSQFYTTPVLTNPANTGMSDNNLRIANNFRNQWGKIGVPFRSFYTSIDNKVMIANQSFGLGGLVVHDQSSGYNLTADEFFLSLSYSKIVNNHQFTVGIQPGYAYKSYNYNKLTYGSQFDPSHMIYDSQLPSSENNLSGNLHYFDMNVGIYWRTLIRNIMPMAGFSIGHIFKPLVTFSTSSQNTRLPMKLTFHGQVYVPLTSRIDITPSALYSSVPGASEFLLGCIEGYAINDFFIPVKKVYATTLFRINPVSNIDAFILGGGFKFSKFDLGITYDFNISPLAQASYFNGAFEISLVFTGGHTTKKNSTEPCYIY